MNALVAAQVARTDGFRRCPATHRPGHRHTEWLHFGVFGDGLCVLVNLSLGDGTVGGALRPRVTLLVWDGEHWHGEVDDVSLSELDVAAGRIDARFASSGVRFERGRFHLWARLRRAATSVELELEPRAFPLVATNAWLYPGAALSWVAIPRLRAWGRVTVGARTMTVADAPAYHDHNWGTCAFSGDFSWEWGVLVPPDPASPWTATFVRLCDRARTRVFDATLALFSGETPWRVFRHGEVRFAPGPARRAPRLHTVPAELRAVRPGAAQPMPARLGLACAAEDDHLAGSVDAGLPTRIVAPTPAGGATVVHESWASGRLEGRVRGRDVVLQGLGVLEVVDGGS